LVHSSPDGKGGYPGNVKVGVTYTLDNANRLAIDYEAASDKTTVLTLTNHAYFNLSGDLKNTVHNHEVTMNSSEFLELDEQLIPTGRKRDVSGTPFDFRNGSMVAGGIASSSEQNIIAGGGYDHYFIFDRKKRDNAVVREKSSGRILSIETDQPGMVMYTANGLDAGLTLEEGESKKHLG